MVRRCQQINDFLNSEYILIKIFKVFVAKIAYIFWLFKLFLVTVVITVSNINVAIISDAHLINIFLLLLSLGSLLMYTFTHIFS